VGSVTREDKTINGQAFYTAYAYNLADQVLTQRLPNGKVVTNAYDSLKRLTSIASDWVDANHPAVLATNFVYHPSGAVTSVDYGNNTRSTRTFNTGLQLKTIQEGPIGAPGAFLNLQYNYDEGVSNNGRIMSIVGYQDRTKDLSFTYDRLYRLATAQTAGSHWGLSWTYDRYGNRLAQSATKGSPPTNSLTVAEATNRVNGWTYDAAGNTLNDGRHTYTYNALNQLTAMDGGAIQG
jgi:YD repeat-containing protein